ncbi:MAG: FAD binding domain-containing protein [Candidatus Limnocylindria bacterium]
MSIEPPVTSPRQLDEAYALLAGGGAAPLAGGTDLMVALTGELGDPPAAVVDLWGIDALRGIAIERERLVLGALTTYADIRRSAACREHLPALVDAAATIGAAQIQGRGTIGGNAANASPAGDTLPLLLACDATLVLGSVRGEREVAAADFWTGYRQTALAPDELIVRIAVPLRTGREVRFRKVGTRRAQSISKVVMAVAWRTGAGGGAWRDVRVALGSVAATPVRAALAEAALEGLAPTPEVADRAAETLAAELAPIDDVRSTAAYRRLVAARILHRIVREAGGW